MKRVVLPIIIIVLGVGLAAGIVATGPQLEAVAPPPSSPIVRTWRAEPQTVQLTSKTHGTVLPRTESALIPEVSGRVTKISEAMVSGGFFSAGDLLFEIDPLDYELGLEQARAALASARSDLDNSRRALKRQQDLARRQSTSEQLRDDALNRVRLGEASLREATARLARAERDLARTKVVAPYDGRVRTEDVDVGQFVNRGNPVAMLYATDYAEVRLPVHDEELAYLDIPLDGTSVAEEARPVAILRARFAGEEHTWESRVVRTEGELDPQTRMIHVVAQVDAPYHQTGQRPPLAVGLFVEAEIIGDQVAQVFVLPRSALQANNQVYVVTENNQLEFRNVDILRVVDDSVYVQSGFSQGETICLSTVTNAVDGMLVRPSLQQNAQQAVVGGS